MRFLRNPHLLAYVLLLLFWFLSLWQLDRAPIVSGDEAWILSPGYKLFTQGIYGSDLFAGLAGMEQHYLEFMPLFPILQGLAAIFFGVGLFTLRFLPVALGTLT